MNKKVASLCVLALGAAGIYGMVGDSLKADDQQNETLAPAQSSTSSLKETSETKDSKEPEESAEVEGQTKEEDPQAQEESSTSQTEEVTTTTEEASEEVSESSGETSATKEESKETTEETKKEESSKTQPSSSTNSSTEASKEETKETSSSTSSKESSEVSTESKEEEKESKPTTSKPASSKETTKENTKDNVELPEESQVAPEGSPVAPVIKKEDKVKQAPQTTTPETQPVLQDARGDLSMSILDNYQVSLTPEFLVSKMAKSDLKGYELPLLSSFDNKNRGILIYEGIKQLEKAKDVKETPETTSVAQTKKEKEDHYKNGFVSTEDLLNQMTQELFGENFYDVQTDVDAKDSVKPGAILYDKDNQLVGLYLGSDYYLTMKKEKNHDKLIPSIEKVTSQIKKEMHQRVLGDVELTKYGKDVKAAYPASIEFQKNKQTEDFIKRISKSAQELGEKYDVFASVMIAQAILESGSGESQLSRTPNYNLFGMKGNYNGQSVTFDTQEDRGNGELYTIQAAFRRYNSYNESLGDYVALLRGGIQGNKKFYEGAWRSKAMNYLTAADFLTGKYATDTQYNKKLSSIIAVYHLTEFDKSKNQKTGPVLKGKGNIPAEYKNLMEFPDYDGKDYNTSGSYPVGQCTWYAYNRVAQLGKYVDEFMGNGGEWGETGKALGYHVTDVPTAGYLISFTPGTAGSDPEYGHVAFVEAVGENGILISEGNVAGGTTISYRIIPNELAKSNLVSYIEPK